LVGAASELRPCNCRGHAAGITGHECRSVTKSLWFRMLSFSRNNLAKGPCACYASFQVPLRTSWHQSCLLATLARLTRAVSNNFVVLSTCANGLLCRLYGVKCTCVSAPGACMRKGPLLQVVVLRCLLHHHVQRRRLPFGHPFGRPRHHRWPQLP